jgi:hypothetical protein
VNEYTEHQKFKELFKTNRTFRDNLLSGFSKSYKIDIIALDEWLISEHGYRIEEHGSTEEFIVAEFGQEASDFVRDRL